MRWVPCLLIVIFALLSPLTAGCLYAVEYVAFSLKVAQQRMPKASDAPPSPEVVKLGGITKVAGLVYDRKTGDLILVGERDPGRAPLTLDDLAVALRARFIHNQWPLVSIDPTEETHKTEMQSVRFEGEITDTQFGADLLDADYTLKQIGMGLLPAGLRGLQTYWDFGRERTKASAIESFQISSRFWFYPVLPSVAVREDVVAIKGLKVGVFTEVLAAEIDGKKIEDLSTFQDTAGDRFAKAITEHFGELTTVHLPFSRLQGLDELVALTRAIEEMDDKPDLSFWLRDYRVQEVKTKRAVKVLQREETSAGPKGRVYRMSGGVQLMAIALRLKAGDVTALREAVLTTRPRGTPLAWTFAVEDWGIVGPLPDIDMQSMAELYAHGEFLFRQKNYDVAIAYWRRVVQGMPEMGELYYRIGQAFERKGLRAVAADYYSKALALDPFRKNFHVLEHPINAPKH